MEYEMAEYTVILYDLANQPIMDISKYVSFSLELKLNDTSTFSFSMDGKTLESLCAAVGTTPRQVLYPARTEVKVYRNDNALFGGIISQVTPTYGVDAITLDVSADSYIQYFSKRLLNKTYSSTDRSDIAWDAIDTVQSVTYGDLGVTQGTLATTYDSDLTADYRDVKSIIKLYTYAQPTTYDFEITPDKVFNTYTRLGSDKPEIELVYPQNIISIRIPRSSDTLYNKVIGIGSGIGVERLESIQEDATSQLTYRVQESKQLFSTVSEQTTLDDNTEGVLEQSKGVLELPELSVKASDIELDTTRPGDSITVRIENSTIGDDVNGLYRIYGMSLRVDLDGNEDVSLSFYNPQSGGEIEQA
jgi:hypothetical protein